MVTLEQTERFHKRKKEIPSVVLSKTGRHEIIYGARALNKRFPQHLRRATVDYDIFSPTPKKDALETERALDKRMGFNAFKTEPAMHEDTWKVKSLVDGEGYADYTKPDKPVPHRVIGGKKYVRLTAVKTSIKKTLKDPEAKFRHAKDRDALNRIKVYEKLKAQKARARKRVPPKGTLRFFKHLIKKPRRFF